MSYRIAGIDVHKKMLAVVVSDVEIESEYQFERRMFSSNPEQLRSLAAWLVEPRGRRSSHGVDGAILETPVGSTGKVLDASTREASRRKAEVRHVASGAGAIQSRTERLIPQRWPFWPMRGCGLRRNNCVMRSARARSSSPCTDGS